MKALFTSIYFLLISYLSVAMPAKTVAYTISPLKKGSYDAFLIEMTMKGNATGKTRLSLPFEIGLYRPQDHIRVIDVVNGQKHHLMAEDSSSYQIEHKPNAILTVKYIVENALKDSLPTLNEVYAQMLTNKYFYVLGSSFWIVPEDSSAAKYSISLKWQGFPSTWTYLSSHSGNGSTQTFQASLGDFYDAVYMGGDFRIHKELINGKPLYLGVRGQWSFSDDQVFDLVRKTVRAQRAFWNDYNVKFYTVGLLPVKYENENEREVDGRGFSNTFVTAGTNTKALGLDDLTFLYNHELMHHWFGHILKQAEPENAYKWFHEGFTDYFAHVAMLDGGLFDQEAFKKRINNVFSVYYSDSTHQWPNEKLQNDYWSSPAIKILPYQRGLVFAAYLNESIKKYSRGTSSLKQVVQHMLAEARLYNKPFSVDRFLQLLKETTGQDYAPIVERFITQGSFIAMADWEKVTDKVVLGPTEVYDLGFTTDKGGIGMNARLTSFTEGGDAQKVGLQVGDVMVGFKSDFKPTSYASITVKRGEETLKFKYLPSRRIMVPQLK